MPHHRGAVLIIKRGDSDVPLLFRGLRQHCFKRAVLGKELLIGLPLRLVHLLPFAALVVEEIEQSHDGDEVDAPLHGLREDEVEEVVFEVQAALQCKA